MRNSILTDSLSPVLAKMKKNARERSIFSINVTLVPKQKHFKDDLIQHEILKWAQKRCESLLPKQAWEGKDFDFLSGGRNCIGVSIENETSYVWTIRQENPDPNVANRIWMNEITVGRRLDHPIKMGIRCMVNCTEDSFQSIEPATPGFLRQISEKYKFYKDNSPLSLLPEPWAITSDDEVDELVSLLTEQNRTLPIIVVSETQNSQKQDITLIDTEDLAKTLFGVANVVSLPFKYSWRFSEILGEHRSVFNGGVRVYMPGFSSTGNPYDHRLFLGKHLNTEEGVQICKRWIKWCVSQESLRHGRLGQNELAFKDVRAASLKSKQAAQTREGASDSDQLETAKGVISILESQLQSQKEELAYFSEECDEAEERAKISEQKNRSLILRNKQLSEMLSTKGFVKEIDSALPKKWSEFEEWCDTYLAEEIALTSLARRGLSDPEFHDPEQVARCVKWLAKECRQIFLNGGAGSIRGLPIPNESGIRNEHCGSTSFSVTWQGNRYEVDWHISGSNSREPRYGLRIYYFWDEASEQIVIADMPAHRRTDAT